MSRVDGIVEPGSQNAGIVSMAEVEQSCQKLLEMKDVVVSTVR